MLQIYYVLTTAAFGHLLPALNMIKKCKGWRPKSGVSWQVDETYVKVKGKWVYLYRAIDKRGRTINFYLSSRRNAKVAKRFLGKGLKE